MLDTLAPTRDPDHCAHSHLESIRQHTGLIPNNGAIRPCFVCSKCGAVFFTTQDSWGRIKTIFGNDPPPAPLVSPGDCNVEGRR